MATPFFQVTIRSSSLNGYVDCPRRSAARLFWHDVKDAGYRLRHLAFGIGASIGTALHGSAALALAEKLKTGSLPPASVMQDAARDKIVAATAEGVTWDRETPNLDTAKRQLVRMAASYCHDIAPGIEPILVEEQLEASYEEGIILTGRPDVIAREVGQVRDLKSGKKRQNCKAQLGAYSLIARSNDLDIERLAEDVVARTPLSKPQPDGVTFLHNLGDAETAAIRILDQMIRDLKTFRHGSETQRITAGDPWAFAANPSSTLCGDRYCPAHSTAFCKEWMDKTSASDA